MILNIANIQHFSVGDGPGIRTTVFFKGCNLRCPWCHNPETIPFGKTLLSYPHLGKTETCGKELTVEEVLREVLEDRDFYEESGGGVTLSGGEVMLSADKAALLAEALHEEGVSVFVDTAGCVPYGEFRKMNPFTDCYLFDFKTPFPEKYKKIGGNLSLITDNIKRLISDGMNVRIRIPLIPDFNTDEESVRKTAIILREIGVKNVDLLPFHRTGSGKYEAMGKPYVYKDTKPPEKSVIADTENEFSKYFTVRTEA